MIPKKLLNDILCDPFYKRCCITGEASGKIDFHHNLIFAGKQVQEKFAILPVHNSIHQYHMGITSDIKEELNKIMASRMTEEELNLYSKVIDYRKFIK